jgi:hypothetical protein
VPVERALATIKPIMKPTMIVFSSPSSSSICSVSFCGVPLRTRASIAPRMTSWIFFVAHQFRTADGLGKKGSSTEADVFPRSSTSYRPLRRRTSAASSASSAHERLRTLVWKTSCARERRGGEKAGLPVRL